jgi:hypothetical protein
MAIDLVCGPVCEPACETIGALEALAALTDDCMAEAAVTGDWVNAIGWTALAVDTGAALLAAGLLLCWNDRAIGTVTRFSPDASAVGVTDTSPIASAKYPQTRHLLLIVNRITKQLTR